MSERAPAVALLFDDTELGAQLRTALCERGARIVHEGGVASFDGERLRAVGADVVVVNLDDTAGDALEALYALIDGDRPRVVFNDAQASRALAGWDRDRWARHLAVKVLEQGDVDPPRPADARGIEQPDASLTTPAAAAVDAADATAAVAPTADIDPLAALAPGDVSDNPPSIDHDPQQAQEHLQRANDESESLAAELEALLASDGGDIEPPADGAMIAAAATADWLDAVLAGDDAEPEPSMSLTPPADAFPEFSIPEHILAEVPAAAEIGPPAAEGLDDLLARGVPELHMDDSAAPRSLRSPPDAPVSAPTAWALLDDDAPPSAILPRDSSTFGVEKLSAADFLAPDVEPVAKGYQPVMNLELVSLEEAIAPRPISAGHEMHLDELHMALSRLVLTGAALDGAPAAAAFYAALPADVRATFLHTQHLGGRDAGDLVAELARGCALSVRVASAGVVTRPGEVLVVPADRPVRLHRDGRVELGAEAAGREASIDDSFTMAAEGFGRDALAIVFSGRSVDAVAGAQAIHDRGGNVWVESATDDPADMVNGISAERLANYSGTPQALAAHLIEVFP